MAPLAYLSLHIAVWTLIELLRLPNQRFGGYRASAERTNQPHVIDVQHTQSIFIRSIKDGFTNYYKIHIWQELVKYFNEQNNVSQFSAVAHA